MVRLACVIAVALLGSTLGCSDETDPASDTVVETDTAMGTCEGTSVPCRDRRTENQCVAGVGCTYRPEVCAGNGATCADQTTQATCQTAEGCAWSPSFCTGVAQECGDYADRSSCTDAPACVWHTSL